MQVIFPGAFNCYPFLIKRLEFIPLFREDEQQSVVTLYIRFAAWFLVESSSKNRNLHFTSLHFLIKNKLLFI